MNNAIKEKPGGGFSLIELLLVIAIIAVLAAMLLPALAKTRTKGQTTVCLNNLKQLQVAWELYAGDHGDAIVPNKDDDDGAGNWVSLPGSWVLGNAQLDLATTNIQGGALYPYIKLPLVYHCPADKSVVT